VIVGLIFSPGLALFTRHGIIYLCLAVSFLLAGCRFWSTSAPRSNYLVVGIESNPLQIDPRYSTDANAARIGGLIYNSLLRADERMRLQAELAESWTMPDGRTYVFDLRRDAKFHDGKPLTAEDVRYTYASILNPKSRSPKRGLLKPLDGIDVLGPHRMRFRLSGPHAPFLEQFTIGIVPEGSLGAESSAKPPPGSGPFMLESVDSGEKVTLKANPFYWEGKPSLAGLTFKVVPDALVRVLEFKKGAIGFMQNDIEPDVLPWLERNTRSSVASHDGTTFQYIGINLTHPILRQRKVRQAIALAIDRDSIVRHVLKNNVTPATGLLSPLNWAFDESVPPWPYDPQKAKRLLDEAGYSDPDGDGPRPRFRVSFKTTNIDLRRRIAEAFKEQLARVGVELEIRSYEWGTFYSDVRKGNFHLFSLAWVGVADPDIYFQLFHSDSVPPNGDNRGLYRNSEIDRLLEAGRATVDPAKRKLIYGRVQKLVAVDLPYIPLWWWKNVVVQAPNVKGFVPYPDGDFISFKKVSLVSGPPTL
jgi:peptide/nickel transport system substrate-binding protein